MKKAVLISILYLPLLTGCAFLDFFKKPDTSTHTVQVDSKLLEACAALPNRTGESDEAVAEHHITVITSYGLCAKKQDASIKTIRKLANLPD